MYLRNKYATSKDKPEDNKIIACRVKASMRKLVGAFLLMQK